ncbi:MAG: NAD(P)H-hydrate dehydratase [Bacteroidales bacterium]|nr:NAD(P)H-hydrate dehydratase [Bacteroidales bacterium]
MKILSRHQIRQLDQYTIENEPIKSIDLMERAATACVDYLLENSDLLEGKTVKIFSGRGNNGGDGLVIARKLADHGYPVIVYFVRTVNKHSEDFLINRKRLEEQGTVKMIDINDSGSIPQFYESDVVIDAIFGSGLNNKVDGFIADLITHINKSAYFVISIDIPSGLYCDESSLENAIINADITLTFLPVKLAFLFQENYYYCRKIIYLDIGLSEERLHNIEVKNYVIISDVIASNLIVREKFSHKRNYGHGLIIAGSYGMFGAAVLSVGGMLRSGVGLASVHLPVQGINILQITHPEAIISPDEHQHFFSGIRHLERYNAIGIGPGLGKAPETMRALKLLIQNYPKPIVFDADAINILSENPTWLSFIPKGCVFTPHLKEFERLIGVAENDFERNEMQRAFSKRYDAYVILKGAYTAITCPDGSCYFNIIGNPGMATGGSGDVLTGLITGLLAQGYHPKLAAINGVYLHSLAGNLAAETLGEEALIAGDIINYLGKAFLKVRDEE